MRYVVIVKSDWCTLHCASWIKSSTTEHLQLIGLPYWGGQQAIQVIILLALVFTTLIWPSFLHYLWTNLPTLHELSSSTLQISVCVRFVTIGYMPVGHARYIWRHPSSQGAWVIRVIYQLLKTKISYSVKAIRSTDATINHFIQQCRHGWVLPLEQWVTLSPPWCGLLQKQ